MNTDTKTNGRRAAYVADLERQVRDCIDRSYFTGERHPNGSRVTVEADDERSALRDYVTNQGFVDKWDRLIDRETTHERQHRKSAPAGWSFKFSAKHGARILVISNIGDGARLEHFPLTASLVMRDSAATALLLGFLAREELRKRADLLDALDRLDYSAAGRDAKEEVTR